MPRSREKSEDEEDSAPVLRRPVWKGSISFGLINIPVALFPAAAREELKFRLLRAGDLSPVNYKRVAESDGKEVPWDQIVKGYEYEKGKFVVLKDEDFKRADVEATQTVDIMDFVSVAEINPMFFYKPYYMKPEKGGAKAYALLRDTLRDESKVAIAKVVIKTRQYLAAVKPQGEALLLELMHFADELVRYEAIQFPKLPAVGKGELAMAHTLVEQMTVKWDPAKYKDEYRNSMLAMISEKVAHPAEAPPAPKKGTKAPGNVVDLAEILRRSVEAAASKRQKAPASRAKKAA
jgi:DNA end-binding protein Ku